MKTVILIIACSLLVIPCKAEPNCTEEILGDVSGDCKVDFNDFAITALDWLEAGTLEPNITQEWVVRYSRYNEPTNDDDSPRAMAIDKDGNIYVTGKSYDPSTNYDYATVKYTPDGNELWVARYNGPGNDYDYAQSIAVDNFGNIYVTGYSYGVGTSKDYATIKYDPNGNQLWVARYNGEGNDEDVARAMVLDEFGNIYVTGDSYGDGTSKDYATIKYDSNGNELWKRRYNGQGNGYDYVDAIAMDSLGNIYVTGRSEGSGTNYDYATVKYGPDGNEFWVARYNGPGNNYDHPYAIAVDSEDNIFVAGGSKGSVTDKDYATVKYSPDGNELWVARYNGPGNLNDYVVAIAVGSSDNIYVTGYSSGDGTSYDYATIKYDPNGNQLWLTRYNGPGNASDFANNIAIDTANNVYVAGFSIGAGTSYDYATIKYDPNGNQLWLTRYNGPEDCEDVVLDIAIDALDNVYVTGRSEGAGGNDDYATIKYSQSYDCTIEFEGDTNNDCKVDIFDLAEIVSHWLECNLDPPEACWE